MMPKRLHDLLQDASSFVAKSAEAYTEVIGDLEAPAQPTFLVRNRLHGSSNDRLQVLQATNAEIQRQGKVSLYFHYPRCPYACHGCHYNITASKTSEDWFDLHLRELALMQQALPALREATCSSIYIGGGTPTLAGGWAIHDFLRALLKRIKVEVFEEVEITVETTPELFTTELAIPLQFAGVNRLSMGGFTLDDAYNRTTGRMHTKADTFRALATAKKHFLVVNTDLVYGLPNRTGEDFLGDVAELATTDVGLTYYAWRSERPEERITGLGKKGLQHPTWRALLAMRYAADALLREEGYAEYPLGYWRRGTTDAPAIYKNRWAEGERIPLIGFGPGAYSYWEEGQWDNLDGFAAYAKRVQAGQLGIGQAGLLNQRERAWWRTALSLKSAGEVFLNHFTWPEFCGEFTRFKQLGLCEISGQKRHTRLTEAGRLVVEELIHSLRQNGVGPR